MTTGTPPMCMECKRFRGDMTCSAFPISIPPEIVFSEIDHRKPFKGDHGLQFEQDEARKGMSNNPILAGGKPDGIKNIRV